MRRVLPSTLQGCWLPALPRPQFPAAAVSLVLLASVVFIPVLAVYVTRVMAESGPTGFE